MEIIKTFIASWSYDKAKGYLTVILFLLSLLGGYGWTRVYTINGELNEIKETKCAAGYKYSPPDDINRLYMPR